MRYQIICVALSAVLASVALSAVPATGPHTHHRRHHVAHRHRHVAVERVTRDTFRNPDLPMYHRVSNPAAMVANNKAWAVWLKCVDSHKVSLYVPLSKAPGCERELLTWNLEAKQTTADIPIPRPRPTFEPPQPAPVAWLMSSRRVAAMRVFDRTISGYGVDVQQ